MRILLTVFTVTTLILGISVYLSVRERDMAAMTQVKTEDVGQLVRNNSNRLNSVPGSDVTFVEFLDFECEACRATFPLVEQLRVKYGDRVNFVVRYFPIQAHHNAERAARAVESAAQQGKFELMYKKMYETQSEWSEQTAAADATFRGFASEIGMNMAKFDADYNAPATTDRIAQDVADAKALGVDGAPTIFLNGQRLKFKTYSDLSTAIEQALQK